MLKTSLTFEDTRFDVVDLDNIPWLRGFQIGSALGYRNPSSDMSKLFDRNADEFTAEMTQVLDLPTAGGVQAVRVFSPRGCYLLGMLARTERAKSFRKWALDVLEGRAAPQQSQTTSVPQQIALSRLLTALMEKLTAATDAGMRRVLYQQAQHAARLLVVQIPPMDSVGRTIDQPGLPGI